MELFQLSVRDKHEFILSRFFERTVVKHATRKLHLEHGVPSHSSGTDSSDTAVPRFHSTLLGKAQLG